MPRIARHVLTLAACTAILGGAAAAQRKVPANRAAAPAVAAADGCVRQFTAADWALMLKDGRANKPDLIQRLETDGDYRQKQVENLRQLFSSACQAVKVGIAKDPINHAELNNIRNEVTAVEFERATAKPAPAQALGSISDARVAAFYKTPGNDARFEDYVKVKLELLRRSSPGDAPKQVSDEEREFARSTFARTMLLAADSVRPTAKASAETRGLIALQVKLQQAQFLARLYFESVADKLVATDEEIDKYIAAHSEFDTSALQAKAEGILKRAVAGEDFAALANEYTGDPGNMSSDGKPLGGLYSDVPVGKMLPEFEKAALALEPGKVSPVLTKTNYGYHVIKLERKGEQNGTFTYDVRHILILTQFRDPDDPNAGPMPAAELARRAIEKQLDDQLTAKVVKDNPVSMAEIPLSNTAPVKKATPARRRAGK